MTTWLPHWHAFAYTGKGYTDTEVGKGMAPPSFPPVEVAHWLHRRPGLHIFTEDQVDQAVAWLEKELSGQIPTDADSFPVATRVEYSRQRLREKTNRDVVYGYWSRSTQYCARALILCDEAACL